MKKRLANRLIRSRDEADNGFADGIQEVCGADGDGIDSDEVGCDALSYPSTQSTSTSSCNWIYAALYLLCAIQTSAAINYLHNKLVLDALQHLRLPPPH